ncbi:diheme cytochrome c [Endothiovibrio diazotrophicus]
MKRNLLTIGGLLAATLTTGLLIAPAFGEGGYERGERHEREGGHEREEHERREGREGGWRSLFGEAALDVAPADNPSYLNECGACHFAYQPGLLPARSWEKLMGNLTDHFGDSAELEPAVNQALTAYLVANAADHSDYRRSVGINGSLRADQTPLRITETPYFQRKHHEVPPRLVKENPEVNSWSNCSACHQNAALGSYNEHEVRIPGAGRWDD